MNKLEEAIKRLERATYQRPDNCKNCKYCITDPAYRFEDKNYFCGLIEDSFEACVNYEIYNNLEPLNCPLPEGEDQEDLLQLLSWLKELQEIRDDESIKNKLETIADHYGLESQLNILQEELSELIQAVSKYRRGDETHILEEIADVEIMLYQVKYLIKSPEIPRVLIYDVINKIKSAKIERQLERIKEEEAQL